MHRSRASDEHLLHTAERDPEAFGVFYRRHERVVLGFFVRAAGRGELAVDALQGCLEKQGAFLG